MIKSASPLVQRRCLLLATAIACAALPARAEDAKALCVAVEDEYVPALASGDPAKLAAVYAEDAVVNAPEGVIVGRAAIKASLSWMKPGMKLTYEIKSARQVAGVVICDGDYTNTLPPGSPIKAFKGHYSKILAKVGEAWRLHQLDYSYLPPPPAAPQN